MSTNNTLSKKENNILVNRFNKSVDDDHFIESFQKAMIERLLLNRDRKYHPKNIKQMLRCVQVGDRIRDLRKVNMNISGGLLLSTKVEADFYVLLQELVKDMTGNYIPMDEFLHLLLTWFYQYYADGKGKKISHPFIKISKTHKKRKINQFNSIFSKYYKNSC
jgi:hypothetical protein